MNKKDEKNILKEMKGFVDFMKELESSHSWDEHKKQWVKKD